MVADAHPERAGDELLGSTDGRVLIQLVAVRGPVPVRPCPRLSGKSSPPLVVRGDADDDGRPSLLFGDPGLDRDDQDPRVETPAASRTAAVHAVPPCGVGRSFGAL